MKRRFMTYRQVHSQHSFVSMIIALLVCACAGDTTHPFGFERSCAVKQPSENRRDEAHSAPDARRFHPHPPATMQARMGYAG